MNKLALGSAQFGLDYGINNLRGRIPKDEVFLILDYAFKNNIFFLDTAYSYGESEVVIGEFINNNKIKNFNIISKLPANLNVEDCFYTTLSRLNLKKIYGYLIHDFNFFLKNEDVFKKIKNLKESNLVSKIGFSLYYTSELDYLLDKGLDFDILQIPFNIFDQRFLKYFKILKDRNIEIHSRSVFLQGLFFKDYNNLENKFLKIKNKLTNLNKLAQQNNLTVFDLCLNFVYLDEFVDKIIIGVDNLNHLVNNIKSLESIKDIKKFKSVLQDFKEDDLNIILPVNW